MTWLKRLTLAFLFLATFGGTAWAGWSGTAGDQLISYFPGPSDYLSRFPKIASYGSSNLYAVWLQGKTGVPYEVFFSKSTDNGRTWTGTTADRRLSNYDGEASLVTLYRHIDIAVNSLGHIFVVWAESLTNQGFEIMLLRSTDGGSTWIGDLADSAISFPGGNRALEPAITVDANDGLHVVWYQNPGVGTTEIHYGYSSDNGVTWTSKTADRVISFPDGNNALYPDVAVDAAGNVYVVWTEQTYASVDSAAVHFGKKPVGSTQFTSETADYLAAKPHRSSVMPSIVITPNNNIHVVYEVRNYINASYRGSCYYTKSTDGGATWSGLTTERWVDLNPFDDSTEAKPYIVASPSGKLAVVYESSGGHSEARVSYSTDDGATWSGNIAAEIVGHWESTGDNRPGYNPHICFSAGDTLHVVWNEDCLDLGGSSGYYEIMYSRGDVLAGATNTGNLVGTVKDLNTLIPLGDVVVVLRDSTSAVVGTDTTDWSGRYAFLMVNTGTHSASFSKYTHHDTTVTNIVIEQGVTDTLDVFMRPVIQGTISGTVYEQTGTTPQESVIVRAYDPGMVLKRADTTDASGNYSLLLYPNTYSISFSKANFHDTTIYNQVLTEGGAIDLDVNLRWSIHADDIGPVSLDVPKPYMIAGNTYYPSATVRNFGYEAQTYDLNLRISYMDTLLYDDTVYGAIVAAFSTDQRVFADSFVPATNGTHRLIIKAINPGDANSVNDSLIIDMVAYEHQGQGGPDLFGYQFIDNTVAGGPAFNWIDISTTGTQLSPTLHYFMQGVPIGFPFEFYGQVCDSMWVNSHGEINFCLRDVWLLTNDCPLPDTSTPHAPMAAVFWDFLKVQYEIGQGVYYQYFDDPTNDYTVVQWKVSRDGQPNDSIEFEIIVYQDGSLLFQYKYVSDLPGGSGESATVGLEYDVLPSGLSYLCNDDNPANRLRDSLAIKWTKGAAACEYILGDINGDDLVRGGDVTYGVRYFKGLGPQPPDSCYDSRLPGNGYLYVAGDVNGNCEFRGSDITRLVAYFKGVATLLNCPFFPPPMLRDYKGVIPAVVPRD